VADICDLGHIPSGLPNGARCRVIQRIAKRQLLGIAMGAW
jgi:hypothetical protein